MLFVKGVPVRAQLSFLMRILHALDATQGFSNSSNLVRNGSFAPTLAGPVVDAMGFVEHDTVPILLEETTAVLTQ